MNDIPTEVKRSDKYNGIKITSRLIDGNVGYTQINIMIDILQTLEEIKEHLKNQGAKGPGTVAASVDPSISSPGPAQREVGRDTPASPRGTAEGMVPDEKSGRETPHKESEVVKPLLPHETPDDVAPSNPDYPKNPNLSSFVQSWPQSQEICAAAIEKLSKREGYWAINKAMKGGK